MLSTHYRRPGRPSEQNLRGVRVYGRLAGEALAQALSARNEDGSAGGEPATAPDAWLLPSELLEDADGALVQLAERSIRRIFAAGLNLADVQGSAENPRLRTLVASAVAELDQAVKEIQTAAAIGLRG